MLRRVAHQFKKLVRKIIGHILVCFNKQNRELNDIFKIFKPFISTHRSHGVPPRALAGSPTAPLAARSGLISQSQVATLFSSFFFLDRLAALVEPVARMLQHAGPWFLLDSVVSWAVA